MTRAEILAQIKQAEEDARLMISEANESKSKNIQDSKTKNRELINNVETQSAKEAEQKISQAKEHIIKEKENMLKGGLAEAELIKSNASKNIELATEYLVEQFERAIHA
jgi:V/A-type H+-transporting ATPase subunit G/H